MVEVTGPRIAAIVIVYVCTANVNRSPMAAALTSHLAATRGLELTVGSASTLLRPGHRASPATLAVLRARGIDAESHRSRTLTPELVADAELVLTMERAHLRVAALMAPGAFDKTFTLKEFLRRALRTDARYAYEPLDRYLQRISIGRDPVELLTTNEADEVADPQGGPQAGFVAICDELALLCEGAVELLFGNAQPG